MNFNPTNILAIIGIALPALLSLVALFISIKNRRNGVREILYEKQLDAIFLMNDFLGKVSYAFSWWEIYKWNNEKSSAKEFNQLTYDAMTQFQTKFDTYDSIIPHEIYVPLIKIYKFITQEYVNMSKLDHHFRDEILDQLIETYQESTREFMGVDKLSDENYKLSRTRFKKPE